MFNNPFLKKDPLLEAVKGAQLEGEYRRQAEKIVNEEFGVYSRRAVVREELAAYDAALEEVYAELKEDKTDHKKIDIYHKGEYKASTTWSKNTKEAKAKWLEKNKDHDPKDVKTSYAPLKEGNVETKENMNEATKVYDPFTNKMVSRKPIKVKMGGGTKLADKDLARKDYDGDGRRESPKAEVWGSRIRAAKLAGKMEEEQIDELKKTTLASYVGKSANANYGKEKLEREKGVNLAMRKIAGGARIKGTNEETDYSAQDRAPVTKSAPKEDPSTPKVPYSQLPKPGNRAGSVIDSAKGAVGMQEGTKIVSKGYGKVEVVKGGKKVKSFSDPRDAKMFVGQTKPKTVKEEEQIDEISKGLAHRYAKKSIRRLADSQSNADRAHQNHEYVHQKHYQKIANKREAGIDNALNKLSGKAKVAANEETQLDELSKKTLGSYIKNASQDARQRGAGYVGSGDVKHLRKGHNRVRGIEKAVDRLVKEDEQLDELKRTTLVNYIRKASKAKATPDNITKRGRGMELAAKKMEKERSETRDGRMDEGRIDPVHAKEILDTHNAHGDFFKLPHSTISSLVDTAKKMKYRKGASAPGSTGRMFHQHLTRLASKVVKEDSSFKSAQVTETQKLGLGKSVNEVAMGMPPAITPPSVVGQRMPGIIKRGGTATGKFVNQTKVGARGPSPAPSKGLVPSSNRLPTATASGGMTKTSSTGGMVKTASTGGMTKPAASGSGSGFSYSRMGDTPGVNPPHPSEKIGGFGNFRQAGTSALGRGLAAAGRVAGPIAGAAALSKTIGDVATGTEVGRKAGAWVAKNIPGATAVADTMRKAGEAIGVRDKQPTPTTPGSMNVSKQPAPSVSTSAAAEKVGISQTPKPAVAPAAGTAKPAPVKQSFSQAFQAARQAATTAKQDPNKAQFTWNKGTYQAATNKKQYVPASQQFKTNVGTDTQSQASSTATPAVQEPAPSAQTPGTTTTASVRNLPSDQKFKSLGAYGEPEKMADMKTQPFRKGVDTDKAVAANISPEKTPGAQTTIDPGAVDNEKRKANQLKECVQIGSNKYRIV